MGVALTVAGGALLTDLLWTVLTWGSPSRFLKIDITCGVLALVSGGAAWGAAPPRDQLSLAGLEDVLATNRDALRFLSALIHPTLKERRSLYREDVAGVIEQHRTDSRRYRLIHNVTLAAAFTGYYKYRERSYFLLQTADAIE